MSEQGLLRKIERRVSLDPSGCLNWTGSTDSYGYGQMKWRGRTRLVHRLAYWIFGNKPPTGLSVLHTCDNRRCINPNHLYLGTQRENMRDMVVRRRFADVSGENNPRAKLTSRDVLEIRNAVSHKFNHDGATHSDIAKRYGVSKSTIDQISRGIVWREVSNVR